MPTEKPHYPKGLTDREVEVLGLVAHGMSNREIAEELTISLRTVDFHLRNILSKTDSPNRASAATFAAEHGLS